MCNQVLGLTAAGVYWWKRDWLGGGAGGEDRKEGGYCWGGYCEIGNGKQGGL